jgi:divalent metal cation (Fe/Co/Zn/Cd) transporter
MLHSVGVRLHPAIGIAAGLTAIAAGIALAMPIVGVVVGVMLFATATRWFGSHGAA